MPETKEDSLAETGGTKRRGQSKGCVCIDCSVGGLLELSRREGPGGVRVVESLWGRALGRAKEAGAGEEGGTGDPAKAGSISVCRAVGKSLDLFRCANTQKDPI